MISEEIVLSLLFMLIIFVINLIGYTRVPVLCIIAIAGTMILTPTTLSAFGDDYLFGLVLIMTNAILGVYGVIDAKKGE